jgi:hypothetical protein
VRLVGLSVGLVACAALFALATLLVQRLQAAISLPCGRAAGGVD